MRTRPTAKPRPALPTSAGSASPSSSEQAFQDEQQVQGERSFEFELFTSGISRSKKPFATVEAEGRISVNAAGAKIFGTPEAIELFFDNRNNCVGLRPSTLQTPRAAKVIPRQWRRAECRTAQGRRGVMRQTKQSGARYALYCRCSSDDQAHKDFSTTDVQDGLNRQYVQDKGGTVAGAYKDEAVSGTTLKRKGWQQLLADAKAGLFDAVIVSQR